MVSTLEEVAQLAGVSRSTVSRVINDHPNVHDQTRERVWKAIRQSGYKPNVVARSLVTNRTQIISIVIPEAVNSIFTDPFFPLLLCGTTEACNAHQYQLLLSLFTAATDFQEIYDRLLHSGYADGVIVASAPLNDPLVPNLLRDGVPFVSIGRYPDERVHYVDIDNVGGARMAVNHLLRLGHRRIATITGRQDIVAGQDRLQGYRQGLEARGIPVDERLIAAGDFTEEGGMAAMRALLPLEPTAVFTANDTMAVGAMRVLRNAGLRVPQDVAVVGFDDTPIASSVEPALTTMRQPIERLGAMAVDVLVNMLQNPSPQDAHRILIPAELIVRSSCGATRRR
ncbi:MAG: LacI family DNA-binding transcriptional regulator [Anaerolineae bacterium]|nr:LacI family DNA-binding transcriptional regulator [Anaerolineae bacterium]